MTMVGVQAASTGGLPWRALAWAVALSLLAHALTFWMVNSRLVFSFKGDEGNVSLSARVIEPVPVSLQPVAEQAEPAPFQTPTSEQVGAKPAASAAVSQPTTDALAAEPGKPVFKGNRPDAVIESTPIATNSIAIDAPDVTATVAVRVAPTTGQPAPPGLKLQYPANAQLQFDEISMSKGVSQSGSGLLSWKLDGTSYELALEATAFSRFEKSAGQLSPQGLTPERYGSSRSGRSEQATHFRRELGKIQFSNNKPDEVLMVGAQDRLSVFLQLAGIIGGDQERYRIVNRIPMQVAGLEGAEVWEFGLEGISDINLPAANMQVLKLTRKPRNEYDQLLEIWLSPELGYLPVRIRQSSTTSPDQDFTDLRLRKRP
jgi:hypothetical protein